MSPVQRDNQLFIDDMSEAEAQMLQTMTEEGSTPPTNKGVSRSQEIVDHRAQLISTTTQLNDKFDNLVIALGGGTTALSLTFLKDIVGNSTIALPVLLFASWGLLVLALCCVMGEILCGIEGYKLAVTKLDKNDRSTPTGGVWSTRAIVLRRSAAVAVVLGVLSMALFAFANASSTMSKVAPSEPKQPPVAPPPKPFGPTPVDTPEKRWDPPPPPPKGNAPH